MTGVQTCALPIYIMDEWIVSKDGEIITVYTTAEMITEDWQWKVIVRKPQYETSVQKEIEKLAEMENEKTIIDARITEQKKFIQFLARMD